VEKRRYRGETKKPKINIKKRCNHIKEKTNKFFKN
jgi:hypothetical protein